MKQDIWDYLKSAKKPIVLYGTGNGADKIINEAEKRSIEISGVFASEGFVRSRSFRDMPVRNYTEQKEIFGDMIVLIGFGSNSPEVRLAVDEISKQNEVYAPEVPVCGETVFTLDFAKNHRLELEKTYSLLADDKSKETFKKLIDFKLSGKLDFLRSCESESDEPYNSFLKLSSHEIFIDLGAFTGDTITQFIKNTGGYDRIYAVEPDIKTFKKLSANMSGYKNVFLYNNFASDSESPAAFTIGHGRGSGLSENGRLKDGILVDKMLSGNAATFIKMDVEGNELPAIKGAKKTISAFRPKMQIACYHRSQDLFEIPLEVLKIRPDYRLYLRHFNSLLAWDTNFYFI